jgi:tryptophanyl-tRNA synthetase
MRTLTGITPSGTLHIGNYFGAMRPAIQAQARGDCFYFIADYHSMTSVFDPEERRRNCHGIALDWLACGLDPAKCVLWRQSDVPEVCELTWMIGSLTPMGLLERAHSYKDKIAKGLSPNFGLFAYPVLMAADILLFDTNAVPVGRDQKQHVEMARDIAIKFNQTYGETFVVPEPEIRESVAVVPGLDGQKMSKSYGNTLEIFGDEKTLRKKVMSIVMDSRSPQEPKPDADRNLAVQLLKLVAPPEAATDLENRLRAGGLGYGDLKKALFEQYWSYFAAARARRAEISSDPGYIESVLREGAERARAVASVVLKRARKASGLE